MVDSMAFPGAPICTPAPIPEPRWASSRAETRIQVAEPVVWTDATGGKWLAFFLSCGGPALYWVSVDSLEHQNRADGMLSPS